MSPRITGGFCFCIVVLSAAELWGFAGMLPVGTVMLAKEKRGL